MRDELLSGTRPVLLVQKSAQHADRTPELLRYLTETVGGALEIGVVVNLSRQHPNATRDFLDRCSAVALKIADPELHHHVDQRATLGARQRRHSYLSDPIPDRPSSAFVRQLFDTQRAAGATALLTPTGWIGDADGELELAKAMRWVRAARAEAPTEPLLVALTLPRAWLANPPLRAALLSELVDSNERIWYVRVLWDPIQPRYGQLRDDGLLRGYRELGAVASAEDKVLILPNTGLAGWLATAWGASGLSTGIGLSEQSFQTQVQVRIRGGNRPPPRLRYFERSLLATIDLATHLGLVEAGGYDACDCPYCDQMGAGEPTPDPGRWTRDAIGFHQVAQTARLLELLGGRNPRAVARREVRRALGYLRGLGLATPAGENRPTHLETWDRLLE